jgi:hypothetical protein
MPLVQCLVEQTRVLREEIGVEIDLVDPRHFEVVGKIGILTAVGKKERVEVVSERFGLVACSLKCPLQEELDSLTHNMEDDSARRVLRREVTFEHAGAEALARLQVRSGKPERSVPIRKRGKLAGVGGGVVALHAA